MPHIARPKGDGAPRPTTLDARSISAKHESRSPHTCDDRQYQRFDSRWCAEPHDYARVRVSSTTCAINASRSMGTVSLERSRTETLPASTSFSPRMSM